MILDPDGEHAITDDGLMAAPVMVSELDAYGFPTGQRTQIGWIDPRKLGLAPDRWMNIDHIDLT